MAEIQGSLISELGATTINGTEKIPVEKGSANNHVTTQQVKEFVKEGMKVSELENDSHYATQQQVKDEIANAQLGGGGEVDTSGFATKEELAQALTKYVEKVVGKDLSTNDFTNVLKQKLEGLENYNDAAMQQAIQAINTRIDTLVGTSASTAIDTFNEIEQFLAGITDSSSLTAMLADLKLEITTLIPTAISQLENDSHFVTDPLYVHTDNNFTNEEKQKLAGMNPGDGGSSVPGEKGTTFTPHVDMQGNLSWTNDGGKENPATVNIKGKDGKNGADGVSLGEIALVQELSTEKGSDKKVASQQTVSKNIASLDNGRECVIVDWKDNDGDTRKQIPVEKRKYGLKIAYYSLLDGMVNEQYVGTTLSEQDWIKDSNWARIPTLVHTADEDTVTPLVPISESHIFEGTYFGGNSMAAHSHFSMSVYKLEKGTAYTLKKDTDGGFYDQIGLAVKTSEVESSENYMALKKPEDLRALYPYIGLGEMPAQTDIFISLSKEGRYLVIPPLVIASGNYVGKDIYLLMPKQQKGEEASKAVLYKGDVTKLQRKKALKLSNSDTIDNYDFIRRKACEFVPGTSKNLFDKTKIYKNIAVNRQGYFLYWRGFNSSIAPLELGKVYTMSGYQYSKGIESAMNIALVTVDASSNIVRNVTADDFLPGSEWLSTDKSFQKGGNIFYKQMPPETCTFSLPQASEMSIDNIGLAITVAWVPNYASIDKIQIEEGKKPTSYSAYGEGNLAKVFGFPITPVIEDVEGKTEGKRAIFFGDSIMTYDLMNPIKEKLKLGDIATRARKGDASRHFVLRATGARGEDPNIDYNLFEMCIIQIGTNDNNVPEVTLKESIPSVSLYEINGQYPYTYNNPSGVIKDAVINNELEYFQKLFPDNFYANVSLCLEWILWKNPNIRIYLVSIPPHRVHDYKAINAALLEISKEYGIPFINAQENAYLSLRNIKRWSDDGLHPNSTGYKSWSAYIANYLKLHFV